MTIIYFPGITKHDLEPDQVLTRALGQCESVVICGFTKDGKEYFAASCSDGADTVWHLQRAIYKLMKIAEEF